MQLDPTSADALALLEGLDAPQPQQQKPRQWWDELCAVPDMPELPHQARAIASIPGQSIKHLLPSVETTEKPAVLWALHMALDAHGIPPCVRLPQTIDTPQAAFITTLADLLWISKRHPGHKPQLQRMRNVLREPDTPQWHKAALWAYQHSRGEPGRLARSLALTDAQRSQTATMPTLAQANKRRALRARLDVIREQLLTHALEHPDGTRRQTPDDLADKRMRLLRLYLLLDRDRAATHDYLRRVEGVTTCVRAMTLQLETIARITGAWQLVHGPARRSSGRSSGKQSFPARTGSPPPPREIRPSESGRAAASQGPSHLDHCGPIRAAESGSPLAVA